MIPTQCSASLLLYGTTSWGALALLDGLRPMTVLSLTCMTNDDFNSIAQVHVRSSLFITTDATRRTSCMWIHAHNLSSNPSVSCTSPSIRHDRAHDLKRPRQGSSFWTFWISTHMRNDGVSIEVHANRIYRLTFQLSLMPRPTRFLFKTRIRTIVLSLLEHKSVYLSISSVTSLPNLRPIHSLNSTIDGTAGKFQSRSCAPEFSCNGFAASRNEMQWFSSVLPALERW